MPLSYPSHTHNFAWRVAVENFPYASIAMVNKFGCKTSAIVSNYYLTQIMFFMGGAQS